MSPPLIALALCLAGAAIIEIVLLLAPIKSHGNHPQARPGPSQSHSLAGGDDVFGRHVATRNTTVSE